jgi:hypothetical protein
MNPHEALPFPAARPQKSAAAGAESSWRTVLQLKGDDVLRVRSSSPTSDVQCALQIKKRPERVLSGPELTILIQQANTSALFRSN